MPSAETNVPASCVVVGTSAWSVAFPPALVCSILGVRRATECCLFPTNEPVSTQFTATSTQTVTQRLTPILSSVLISSELSVDE